MDYKERLILLLTGLLEKYGFAGIRKVSLDDHSAKIRFKLDDKTYEFTSDFSKEIFPKDKGQVLKFPIMYWRNERKYIEMKKMIEEKLVHNPVGMRIKAISTSDKMDNIFIREFDIVEWVLDDKITGVYATTFKDKYSEYFNIIASTESGIRVSMELGRLNSGDNISVHEIITQKGIITDQAVDTQVTHYPVYVYADGATKTYNDIDFELYELGYYDIARIRYILGILQNANSQDIPKRYNRYKSIVEGVYKSARENKKIRIEE